MKERPILFSGSMVRAILDGRKTMTRRVIKPQPTSKYSGVTGITTGFLKSGPRYVWRDDKQEMTAWRHCPCGAPGDRLWVRETWGVGAQFDSCKPSDLMSEMKPGRHPRVTYKADDPMLDFHRWRPSIFMPRWTSRIMLEITDVRVERVQKITPEDCQAEGIWLKEIGSTAGWSNNLDQLLHIRPKHAFRVLWDSLNAKRGYGWDQNPWVWAIEFRRADD